MFISWAHLCWEHKRNTEHLAHIKKYITDYRCHVFFTISNVYIQAVLSVILTFVPRQHVLKLNKHGNVNKSQPINIYFLIAGVGNRYFLEKSERPWAHELTSQTGGELMSWSPSVSAALILTRNPVFDHYFLSKGFSMACQNDIYSTHKISCNFQNIVQLC